MIQRFLTFDSMYTPLKCDHSLLSRWAVLYFWFWGHNLLTGKLSRSKLWNSRRFQGVFKSINKNNPGFQSWKVHINFLHFRKAFLNPTIYKHSGVFQESQEQCEPWFYYEVVYFQFFPVCKSGTFVNFGLGMLGSETVKNTKVMFWKFMQIIMPFRASCAQYQSCK